jgi:hypothetical protein
LVAAKAAVAVEKLLTVVDQKYVNFILLEPISPTARRLVLLI